jgi:hypothetical protein
MTELLIATQILSAVNQQPFKILGISDTVKLFWTHKVSSKIDKEKMAYISRIFEGTQEPDILASEVKFRIFQLS